MKFPEYLEKLSHSIDILLKKTFWLHWRNLTKFIFTRITRNCAKNQKFENRRWHFEKSSLKKFPFSHFRDNPKRNGMTSWHELVNSVVISTSPTCYVVACRISKRLIILTLLDFCSWAIKLLDGTFVQHFRSKTLCKDRVFYFRNTWSPWTQQHHIALLVILAIWN